MLNISDWVLFFSTLFLGAVALFVPYLAELVKRRVFAPKLSITHSHEPPLSHLTFWHSRVDPSLEEPVFFFRFQVTNDGKSQARQCEAILEKLWIYDASDKPHILERFSPINLRYDERGTRFVDINPNRRVFWNIGHVSSASYQEREETKLFIDVPGDHDEGLRFLFDLLEYPYSQPNCLVPGKYGLKVSLYSENAGCHEVYFQIAWSGKWQKAEQEMLRELVVTKVREIQ
jgi:hypothetical protein